MNGGGGAFPAEPYPTSSGDIRDGLSQTAAFSERLKGGGKDRAFDPVRDIWSSGMELVRLSPHDADEVRTVCSALRGTPSHSWPLAGEIWIQAGFGDTLYNHVAPPNWESTDCNWGWSIRSSRVLSTGAISARSQHPGGVNLLLLDGSVRFVRDSIGEPVWRALATRNGKDTLDAGAF